MLVSLTNAERDRLLWWLHRPVPPGPAKDLDATLIRKLNAPPYGPPDVDAIERDVRHLFPNLAPRR